jgi:hypothetical protein
MGSFRKNEGQKDGSGETLRLSLKSPRQEPRPGWGSREHASFPPPHRLSSERRADTRRSRIGYN